ncbi:hypothetical protein TNCV_415701 [Trichonephila clavipes]|nr:hypothetical protein TNCV_415701 [Trichonephila clavipes]
MQLLNNLLPTAWRKLYRNSPACGPGVYYRSLMSPSVIYSPFLELSCARPLLQNSHHCGTVSLHTSYYSATEKSPFTKADDSPPSKLHKLLKFKPISSWRHS